MKASFKSTENAGKTTFQTALGPCALTWNSRGITRVELLPSSASEGARPPSQELPAWIEQAARAIALHLEGNLQDLSLIPIDMEGLPPFFRRVCEIARTVKAGSTISYGELAKRAGSEKAMRAVGQAMAKNPLCLLVPCHRVLAKNGKLVGFSAPGGLTTKARLLLLEASAIQG